jgi:hypothetical protein
MELYRVLLSDPKHFPDLDALLAAQSIRYIVVPVAWAPALQEHFGARLEQAIPQGEWTIFILR